MCTRLYLFISLVPGGFAFGDRVYDKATSNYVISPGTMALNSPVTSLIKEATPADDAVAAVVPEASGD